MSCLHLVRVLSLVRHPDPFFNSTAYRIQDNCTQNAQPFESKLLSSTKSINPAGCVSRPSGCRLRLSSRKIKDSKDLMNLRCRRHDFIDWGESIFDRLPCIELNKNFSGYQRHVFDHFSPVQLSFIHITKKKKIFCHPFCGDACVR